MAEYPDFLVDGSCSWAHLREVEQKLPRCTSLLQMPHLGHPIHLQSYTRSVMRDVRLELAGLNAKAWHVHAMLATMPL